MTNPLQAAIRGVLSRRPAPRGRVILYHASPGEFPAAEGLPLGRFADNDELWNHGSPSGTEDFDLVNQWRDEVADLGPIDLKLGSLRANPANNYDYSRRAGESDLENARASLAEHMLYNEHLLRQDPRSAPGVAFDWIEEKKDEWAMPRGMLNKLYRELSQPGAVRVEFGEPGGSIYELDVPYGAIDLNSMLRQERPWRWAEFDPEQARIRGRRTGTETDTLDLRALRLALLGLIGGGALGAQDLDG